MQGAARAARGEEHKAAAEGEVGVEGEEQKAVVTVEEQKATGELVTLTKEELSAAKVKLCNPPHYVYRSRYSDE